MATIVNKTKCTEEQIHLGISTCSPKFNYLRGIFIGSNSAIKIPNASLVDTETALEYLRGVTLDAVPSNRLLFIPFADATDTTKAPEIKSYNRGTKNGVIEYPFSAEAMYTNNGIWYNRELRKLNKLNGLVCFYLDEAFIGGNLKADGLYPIPCDFYANLPKNGDGASNLTEHKVSLSFKNIEDFPRMDCIELDGFAVEDYFQNIIGVSLTATGGAGIITLSILESANNSNLVETRPTAVVQTGCYDIKLSDGSSATIEGVTIAGGNVVIAVTETGAMTVKLKAPLLLEALTVPFGGNGGACYESDTVTATVTA